MTSIHDLTLHDPFTYQIAAWVAAQLRRALEADGVEGVERKLGEWGQLLSKQEAEELLGTRLEWNQEMNADGGYDEEAQVARDSEFSQPPYRLAGATFAAYWRIAYGCTDGRLELPDPEAR